MKHKKRLPGMVTGMLTSAVLVNAFAISSFSSGKTNPVTRKEDPAEKKKTEKKRSVKKSKAVKIYPDLVKRTMHVISKDINDGSIDFFVFGLDGTLLVNHRLNPGDHIKITDLERGTYVYQVFDGDEMTENGKLEIK
ncbi:MAG: hypothetical protein GC171_13085 [Terrimonas sp.]|nr:hypothetical protein [Terrimonas sp.]